MDRGAHSLLTCQRRQNPGGEFFKELDADNSNSLDANEIKAVLPLEQIETSETSAERSVRG